MLHGLAQDKLAWKVLGYITVVRAMLMYWDEQIFLYNKLFFVVRYFVKCIMVVRAMLR